MQNFLSYSYEKTYSEAFYRLIEALQVSLRPSEAHGGPPKPSKAPKTPLGPLRPLEALRGLLKPSEALHGPPNQGEIQYNAVGHIIPSVTDFGGEGADDFSHIRSWFYASGDYRIPDYTLAVYCGKSGHEKSSALES